MRRVLPFLSFVAACGGGPSPIVGTGNSASQMIDASGGQVTLEGVTLAIPAGALNQPTNIKITSLPSTIDRYRFSAPIFSFEPDGLLFAKPATLTIAASTDLDGDARLITTVHPAGRSIAWFQDLHGAASGRTMSAPLRHFSDVSIANLPPCDQVQEQAECAHRCGDSVVYDEQVTSPAGVGLLPIELECVVHCKPCPDGAPSGITLLQFASANNSPLGAELAMGAADAVACDAHKIEIVDDTRQFQWKVDDSGASTLSDLSGAMLFSGSLPNGAALPFGYDGTLPPVAMASANGGGDTITVSGSFSCPGQFIPSAPSSPPDMAGGADMGCPGPAMVTNISPSSGPPGTVVTLTGVNLGCVGTLSFTGADIYTYDGAFQSPRGFTVVSDTEVQIIIPSVDDDGNPFNPYNNGDCREQLNLKNCCDISQTGGVFKFTGLPQFKCP